MTTNDLGLNHWEAVDALSTDYLLYVDCGNDAVLLMINPDVAGEAHDDEDDVDEIDDEDADDDDDEGFDEDDDAGLEEPID